jgi:acetyl esterase/lipase
MLDFIGLYLPDPRARSHHDASPLLSGSVLHAPALVVLCQCDLLQPEGLQYAEKLRAEGGDVQVNAAPGRVTDVQGGDECVCRWCRCRALHTAPSISRVLVKASKRLQ